MSTSLPGFARGLLLARSGLSPPAVSPHHLGPPRGSRGNSRVLARQWWMLTLRAVLSWPGLSA
eukprot:6182340-Alexandrium_andersonii.AAC.1